MTRVCLRLSQAGGLGMQARCETTLAAEQT